MDQARGDARRGERGGNAKMTFATFFAFFQTPVVNFASSEKRKS